VLDDELTPSIEQVAQSELSTGAFEDVVLVDLDHRQLAAPGAQCVSRPGHRLLLPEQGFALDQPLFS